MIFLRLSENADLDPDDTISYKQWTHESHSKLVDLSIRSKHVSEFIQELCEKYDSC